MFTARVHAADAVHLFGDRARFGRAAEIADDDAGRPGGYLTGHLGEGAGASGRAGVQDDVVSVIEQGAGCAEAQPGGGACDEDACHGLFPSSVRWEAANC